MGIFESHAHYDDEAFNEDREALLASFKENGIDYVVDVGASMASADAIVDMTAKYDFIYGALGVHPTETEGLNEEFIQYIKEQTIKNKKIVAIGEIGLDYYWNEPEPEWQKRWFIRQLDLAKELNKPVIIHSREAAKDTEDIMLSSEYKTLQGVIHCFSYSPEMAKKYVDNGFYIGVGGVVTYKNAKKLVETVEQLDLSRILLETDSPYLTPVPHRGERNSSLNLKYVVEKIAALKGVSEEEVIRITNENARKLFGITE